MLYVKGSGWHWSGRLVGEFLKRWPYPRPNLDEEFDAGYRLGLSVGAREAREECRCGVHPQAAQRLVAGDGPPS